MYMIHINPLEKYLHWQFLVHLCIFVRQEINMTLERIFIIIHPLGYTPKSIIKIRWVILNGNGGSRSFLSFEIVQRHNFCWFSCHYFLIKILYSVDFMENLPILQHCVQASKVFGFSGSIGILHWTEASAVILDWVPNSFQT